MHTLFVFILTLVLSMESYYFWWYGLPTPKRLHKRIVDYAKQQLSVFQNGSIKLYVDTPGSQETLVSLEPDPHTIVGQIMIIEEPGIDAVTVKWIHGLDIVTQRVTKFSDVNLHRFTAALVHGLWETA